MTIYRDDLERVYALIEKPENWTQGAYARAEDGDPVGGERHSDSEWTAEDPKACKWCVLGAGLKCGIRTDRLWDALYPISGPPHIFNDTHTHAEVLALLKAAIDRAPVRLERPDPESVA